MKITRQFVTVMIKNSGTFLCGVLEIRSFSRGKVMYAAVRYAPSKLRKPHDVFLQNVTNKWSTNAVDTSVVNACVILSFYIIQFFVIYCNVCSIYKMDRTECYMLYVTYAYICRCCPYCFPFLSDRVSHSVGCMRQ